MLNWKEWRISQKDRSEGVVQISGVHDTEKVVLNLPEATYLRIGESVCGVVSIVAPKLERLVLDKVDAQRIEVDTYQTLREFRAYRSYATLTLNTDARTISIVHSDISIFDITGTVKEMVSYYSRLIIHWQANETQTLFETLRLEYAKLTLYTDSMQICEHVYKHCSQNTLMSHQSIGIARETIQALLKKEHRSTLALVDFFTYRHFNEWSVEFCVIEKPSVGGVGVNRYVHLSIGCQTHTVQEWIGFAKDPERINAMHPDAMETYNSGVPKLARLLKKRAR